MRPAPWTPEEESRLLALCRKNKRFRLYNWPAILKDFPGRSRGGLLKRLFVLRKRGSRKYVGFPHWTQKEVRTLAVCWKEDCARTIMRKLRRHSWKNICKKARKLGLGSSIQRGWYATNKTAKLIGVHRNVLLKIARFGGISPHPHVGVLGEVHHTLYPYEEIAAAAVEYFNYTRGKLPWKRAAYHLGISTEELEKILADRGTPVPAKNPDLYYIEKNVYRDIKESLNGKVRTR